VKQASLALDHDHLVVLVFQQQALGRAGFEAPTLTRRWG